MNVKLCRKPEIPETFLYGEIERWEVSPSIRKDRGKYNYGVTLFFNHGQKHSFRIGGFGTKKMASKSREITITNLNNHVFVPFKYTVKEFYDYWLYYYMADERKAPYTTLMTYRNVIYNYIIPACGNMKMDDMLREHILRILNSIPYESVRNNAYGVLYSSFKTAMAKNIISSDPIKSAIHIHRMSLKEKMNQDLKKGALPAAMPQPKFKMPTVGQVCVLLVRCKEKYHEMFLPLLISITSGCRISETLGLKYKDVDFINNEIHVERQVGRSVDNSGILDGTGCVQELKTKSRAGIRKIPVPGFLIDEIILARARYEKIAEHDMDFYDGDYICCKRNGIPYHRSSFRNMFKSLLNECGVEPFRWHDIRHIYATLLSDNDISLKAISVALGHSTEQITKDVYVERKEDFTSYPEIDNFVRDVLPSTKEQTTYSILEISGYAKDVLPEETLVKNNAKRWVNTVVTS